LRREWTFVRGNFRQRQHWCWVRFSQINWRWIFSFCLFWFRVI
jgi:hypothetical protein